ncbi:hypothetical protein WA026_011507 [Henosepilachna vigintioctopunctata]|uniref:Uncharacterized protein n=1 Tax=Henosepilachna vigintioctopunctata TaxID=420089 RepID=A0AAW1TU26_9CUCU
MSDKALITPCPDFKPSLPTIKSNETKNPIVVENFCDGHSSTTSFISGYPIREAVGQAILDYLCSRGIGLVGYLRIHVQISKRDLGTKEEEKRRKPSFSKFVWI